MKAPCVPTLPRPCLVCRQQRKGAQKSAERRFAVAVWNAPAGPGHGAQGD